MGLSFSTATMAFFWRTPSRLRRWLPRAWQATHKGRQDAAEFARDRCRRDGKSFVWIKQPVVFEQRQRRQWLYVFRVVTNNVWSSVKMVGTLTTILRPASMGEGTERCRRLVLSRICIVPDGDEPDFVWVDCHDLCQSQVDRQTNENISRE
jgi:hypothetical protein